MIQYEPSREQLKVIDFEHFRMNASWPFFVLSPELWIEKADAGEATGEVGTKFAPCWHYVEAQFRAQAEAQVTLGTAGAVTGEAAGEVGIKLGLSRGQMRGVALFAKCSEHWINLCRLCPCIGAFVARVFKPQIAQIFADLKTTVSGGVH